MLVVAANTWFASRELNQLFVEQGWRAHTLEVITHTRAAELGIAQADEAVRGYLLVGLKKYDDQYRTAEQKVSQEVGELRRLTADNDGQQQRLNYLQQRILVRFTALDSVLAMRSTSSTSINMAAHEAAMSSSPDGGPTVRFVLSKIEEEEQRLLVDRNSQVEHAHHMVWGSFIGASILDLLLILAAFEFLIRMSRDRTLLGQKAEEIAGLNVELKALNSELESRVEQRTRELAAANQELEAFSYSVSHDLRAPLRTIDGFSLALQEDFSDKLNDEGRDYIARVRNGVQRMGSLIDALLQLSRVTRGDLVREQVNLSQLATLVFNDTMAAVQEQRNVVFTVQPGLMVDADPRLLRVALENLIGNAVKYSARTENARIELGAEDGRDQRAGQTVYFIRDNGAGFDMQYVDRLFTAFQRLHGDRDFKGSGIGLATVSRIIRRHHGSIWAVGEIGHGSTFYFTLKP